jgi:hypothetical protein
MANTYEAIATVTVTGATAATIDFTSIPATYTDLCLLISARNDAGSTDGSVYFNSDTTDANYSRRVLFGDGSSTGSAAVSNARFFQVVVSSATSNVFSNSFVYIPNYTGNTNKSLSAEGVNENNGTAAIAAMNAGLWNNSAAITAIKLQPTSANFVQYSSATLYGIKNS